MALTVVYKNFSPEEHHTWQLLFERQAPKREEQIYSVFDEGIKRLAFPSTHVPDIHEVNRKLAKLTGFQGIPVVGLEKDASFFEMLSKREFPIGNFIRDRQDLSYTPAPDVFHDLYGHLPFFIDSDYANFCADLGKLAMKYHTKEEAIKQFSRLFWFTIEFALIKTTQGKRIFGAGIASSHSECAYALGSEPEVRPFDLDLIRNHDFKIDDFQRILYLLEDTKQLYSCLPEYERKLKQSLKS